MVVQDEEDTSIFNLGIALDAAGTEAVLNFGSNNAAGGAGSTFTTHQQQQAEQEQAEKQLSQMQVNDLSAATQTGTNDLVLLLNTQHSCLIESALQQGVCGLRQAVGLKANCAVPGSKLL